MKLLLLALIIPLTGCSYLSGIDETYPSQWPNLNTNSGDFCRKLNGDFQNRAAATYSPTGDSDNLASRFGFDSIGTNQELINISCVDGKNLILRLNFNGSPSSIKTIPLYSDGWTIKNGALIFPVKKRSVGDGFGGYVATDYFQLAVGADGSLIGLQKTSTASLAMWVVPMGGSQKFWFRWQKLTTE